MALSVAIILVGAAVGGAVGGTQASKKPAPSLVNTTQPTSNNSSPAATGLVSKSKLASVNYTDANNVAHYRVYFQVLMNAIYQFAWNSSAQMWAVSPVTTKDMLDDSTVDLDANCC